jgi:SAM-dependent methyltransferase
METTKAEPDAIRRLVRENYAKIASAFKTCCNAGNQLPHQSGAENTTHRIGYSNAQIDSVPDAAAMGLGCGNPQAIARLKPGETVLDLGSGAGYDCFLAASAVGESGRVIGVDMTDGMIRKARRNATKAGIGNVSFRAGEIERLPVADNTVDVIMSNCVINLSPEKEVVFREAFRVLKPGGRLAVSDVVAVRPLPASMLADGRLHCACIGGAALVADIRQILEATGFEKIEITTVDSTRDLIEQWVPGENTQDYVVSAFIEAAKPTKNGAR